MTPSPDPSSLLKMTLPKGRIQEKVLALLDEAGVSFRSSPRSYRPVSSDPTIEGKVLKPQNIPSLVALGRHDCGFTGADWVYEQRADVVELLDLGFDPVKVVAAMPEDLYNSPTNPLTNRDRQVLIASEYPRLTQDFIAKHNLNALYVQSFGATEALPPEDADLIVDNTSTGTTLRHNRLVIVDELMRSTTRFIAHKSALDNPVKRQKLDELVMLMQASLRAKAKVLLEMNVSPEVFEAVVGQLPAMRSPTVSPLHGADGFAVKVAVDKSDVAALVPRLVAAGARDILEYRLEKIVV
jgi:ATP phosphoribosyltransferase